MKYRIVAFSLTRVILYAELQKGTLKEHKFLTVGSELRVGAATPADHQGCRHYSHRLLPLDLLAPLGLQVRKPVQYVLFENIKRS